MHRRLLSQLALITSALVVSQLSCNRIEGALEDERHVELPDDLRTYARQARANLSLLTPEQRCRRAALAGA